ARPKSVGQRENVQQLMHVAVDPVRRYEIAREWSGHSSGVLVKRIADDDRRSGGAGEARLRKVAGPLESRGHGVVARSIRNQIRQIFLREKEEEFLFIGIELARNINRP